MPPPTLAATFRLLSSAVSVYGIPWFEDAPSVLELIASLTTVQLRVVFDTPEDMNCDDVAAICGIVEVCIQRRHNHIHLSSAFA